MEINSCTSGPRLTGFLDDPDLFLWSQFCHEYLLVMIDIRNYNLFRTTSLKSVVKASLFCFEKAKASLAVDSNAHSNEV